MNNRSKQVKRITCKEHLLFESRSQHLGFRGSLAQSHLRVNLNNCKSKRWHRNVLALARIDAATARAHFRIRVRILRSAHPLELAFAKDFDLSANQITLADFGRATCSRNACAVNLYHLRGFRQVHNHHAGRIVLTDSVSFDVCARRFYGQHRIAIFKEIHVGHVNAVVFRRRLQ